MKCASMKHSKQDEELANTGPRPFPSKDPTPETLATGKPGRFNNGVDLFNAALKAPEM